MEVDPSSKSQLVRKANITGTSSTEVKKRKTEKGSARFPNEEGILFTFGNNEDGQLGLSVPVAEEGGIRYPERVVELTDKVIQIATGALHTAVLTDKNKVITFGCNDAGALGRHTAEEEDTTPGLVSIPAEEKIIQVTAGDSHSAALTESGKVFCWGGFRDSNGKMGLQPGIGNTETPTQIHFSLNEPKIVKIASGSHHLVALSEEGEIYTLGNNEFGQLGRRITSRTLLRSQTTVSQFEAFLQPGKVKSPELKNVCDIWAGADMTFCKHKDKEIWAFGLNANSQLGWQSERSLSGNGDGVYDMKSDCHFVPRKSPAFNSNNAKLAKPWKQIAMGERHTIALNHDGKVFALGDGRDGRLGLGEDFTEHSSLVMIPTLQNETCVQIACGGSTSYAITSSGKLYAWGFGPNLQLATGGDEDANVPTLCKASQDEDGINGRVVAVDAGSQHVAITINNDNDEC